MKVQSSNISSWLLLQLSIMLGALLFLTVMANRPIADIPSFALSEINEINEINKKEPKLCTDFCTIRQNLLLSIKQAQGFCSMDNDPAKSPQPLPVHTPPPEYS